MNNLKEIIERTKSRFEIKAVEFIRDDLAIITAEKNEVIGLLTHLRDLEGFGHLVLISAVDWIEKGTFQLTYILHSYREKADIAARVEIPRDNPVMESAHHLWASARVYQQELKEMYGIDFPGSPRVDEPFVLEGWDNIPPMRRDFDTAKYSEETFFPREGRYSMKPKDSLEEKAFPLEGKVKREITELLRGKEKDRGVDNE